MTGNTLFYMTLLAEFCPFVIPKKLLFKQFGQIQVLWVELQ